MHSTKNLNDHYLGSGREFREAVKEYGSFFLQREILYFCHSREIAISIESKLIKAALISDPDMCYNLTTRLGGGNYGHGKDISGENNPFYGKKHTKESLKKMSDSLKEHDFSGKRNPFYGKKHKPESIEAANKKREEKGTYYIDKNPNRLKAILSKDGHWWCTPNGCFHSASAATECLKTSKCTIISRCIKGDEGEVIVWSPRIPKEWVGKTWKELGYYRLVRKGYTFKENINNG